MEIIKSLTSATKRGASKVQNFVKNHQGVVRTAMMMLLFVSVTSVMAQTPAGAAGSKAFTAVTTDLKTCNEQRGERREEEDHDGRWCLYLPHRCCYLPPTVLWFVISHEAGRPRKSKLPSFQGTSTSS